MFLHGNLLHVVGNMYFLAIFGDNVEDRIGPAEYLGLYFLGGVGAAVAHMASMPGSDEPMLGASGAISAVLGAYAYFFPRRRLYMNLFVVMRRVPAILYLAVWLAMQFYFVLQGAPSVAWWAHIGGVAAGVLFAAVHRAVLRRRLLAAQIA